MVYVTNKFLIMEKATIEYFDKLRYQLVKWMTVGWGLWFGVFIINDYYTNKIVIVLL